MAKDYSPLLEKMVDVDDWVEELLDSLPFMFIILLPIMPLLLINEFFVWLLYRRKEEAWIASIEDQIK